MRIVTAAVVCLSFVILCACFDSSDRDRATPGAVYDSAGIEIVVSTEPRWTDREKLRLDSAPMLDIGGIAPGPAELFTQIAGAAFLDGDLLVVANGRAPPQVRVFALDGTHVRTFGRQGEGPQEFRGFIRMWTAPPDTILVYDHALRRMSYFSSSTGFIKSKNAPSNDRGGAASPNYLLWDRFADGTFLVIPNRVVPRGTKGQGRAKQYVFRGTVDEMTRDTIGLFEWADFTTEEGRLTLPFFGWVARFKGYGDRFLTGIGSDYAIDEYDFKGKLHRRIRRAFEPVQITESIVERFKERAQETVHPSRRTWLNQQYARPWAHKTLPAYANSFVIDNANRLWVQNLALPDADRITWSVFNASRQFLGEVDVPSQFTVSDIANDLVLGVWKDDLDVETVRVYRLVRP